MCLEWCHVRSWLINNDIACATCAHRSPERLPDRFSCTTCTHRGGQVATAGMCGLTHEALPTVGRCCHWSVTPTTAMTLVLSDADLAPWLRGPRGVAGVFDESETAPEVSIDAAGCVAVRLNELSVPLVYGVPSSDWEAALGWEPVRHMSTWEFQPLPDADALLEALELIPTGGRPLITALDSLAELLGGATTLRTDDTWRKLTTDMLALCRAHHPAEPAIQQALQRIEDAVCT